MPRNRAPSRAAPQQSTPAVCRDRTCAAQPRRPQYRWSPHCPFVVEVSPPPFANRRPGSRLRLSGLWATVPPWLVSSPTGRSIVATPTSCRSGPTARPRYRSGRPRAHRRRWRRPLRRSVLRCERPPRAGTWSAAETASSELCPWKTACERPGTRLRRALRGADPQYWRVPQINRSRAPDLSCHWCVARLPRPRTTAAARREWRRSRQGWRRRSGRGSRASWRRWGGRSPRRSWQRGPATRPCRTAERANGRRRSREPAVAHRPSVASIVCSHAERISTGRTRSSNKSTKSGPSTMAAMSSGVPSRSTAS